MGNVEISINRDEPKNLLVALQLREISLEMGLPIKVEHLGESLPPLVNPELKPLAQSICTFVQAPTITFPPETSHTVRREFIAKLEQRNDRLYNWLETNRLRYNHLLALGFLPLIYQDVLRHLPLADELLKGAINNIPPAEDYNDLHLTSQVFLTKKVAGGLKDVYTQLQDVDVCETTLQ